jgi:hypothetical protein
MLWWQFGLFGGVVLSLATALKVIGAVVGGLPDDAEWKQLPGFAAAIFGMGFLCGVIAWAGKGLNRRIGMAGDAIVGLAVMVAFFSCCMLLYEPKMLGENFTSDGLPMFGMAVLFGLIGGAWIGRDLRRESST